MSKSAELSTALAGYTSLLSPNCYFFNYFLPLSELGGGVATSHLYKRPIALLWLPHLGADCVHRETENSPTQSLCTF